VEIKQTQDEARFCTVLGRLIRGCDHAIHDMHDTKGRCTIGRQDGMSAGASSDDVCRT
jgi:hypothetical protein